MEFESCNVLLCLVVAVLAQTTLSHASTETDTAIQARIISQMDHIQKLLSSASASIKQLDSDLEQALYSCLGLQTKECQTLRDELAVSASYPSYPGISSSLLPFLSRRGLREEVDPSARMYKGLHRELSRKRDLLKRLASVVHGAHSVLKTDRKRSCSLNLGFHCQTEDVSNFADMYDYLNSPMSPGKKRSV